MAYRDDTVVHRCPNRTIMRSIMRRGRGMMRAGRDFCQLEVMLSRTKDVVRNTFSALARRSVCTMSPLIHDSKDLMPVSLILVLADEHLLQAII